LEAFAVSVEDLPISMSINGTHRNILCGYCGTQLSWVGNADPKSGVVGCAACGNRDNVQKVVRTAMTYVQDDWQLLFNKLAADVSSEKPGITFSGSTKHKSKHRFIVDFASR
jgi:hypothetical protein